MNRRFWYCLSIGFFILCFFGGRGSSLVAWAYPNDKALRLSVGDAPRTVDPQKFKTSWNVPLLNALFDRLVVIDPVGHIQPSLATSWDVSEDGLVYTFKLREDLRFVNGSPLTAEDVVFSFKRMLKQANKLRQRHLLEGLLNAKEIILGHFKSGLFGVRALEDGRVEFRLEYPQPFFLELLSTPFGAVLSKASLLKSETKDTFATDNWKGIVTSGPYRFLSANKGEWKLTANPNFWGKRRSRLRPFPFCSTPLHRRPWRLF